MSRRSSRPSSARKRTRGFSLVELLVAVVLGMALTLALTTVMVRQDSGKRTLVSSNDMSLTTAYLSFALDRELRSAGSGFTQDWRDTFGCVLRAARGGAQILPATAAFPAPFAAVPQQVRLAPLLIHAGAGTGGSDVLAVATGSSGLGETPLRVQPGSATINDLRLPSTVGLRANDLVLVAEAGVGCMVQQVGAPGTPYGASQLLTFAGNYAKADIDSLQLVNLGAVGSANVSLLGSTVGNLPMLQLFGVGADNTLFSYDLLQLDGSGGVQPLASGVSDLRALYGVDTTNDGLIDSWISPTAAGYTAATLSDGSAASQQTLMTIMAVRIGMVLRSDRIEREDVAPPTITLFADLPAAVQHTHTIAAADRRQRARSVEFTVPLRNVMLAAR